MASQEGDIMMGDAALARAERRHAASIVAGVACVVVLVLIFGGALSWVAGLAAAAAVVATTMVYLAAADIRPAQPPRQLSLSDGDDGAILSSRAAMIAALPDAACLVDQGGHIVRANDAAQALFRLPPSGGLLSSVLRQPAVLRAARDAFDSRAHQAQTFMMLSPRERHMRVFAAPVAAASVRPAHARSAPGDLVLLVFHDESAQKRAERERLDFLANASHELRTPLTSLAGFVETLQGHAKDDVGAREKFLAIMAAQTHRMRRLIDDLLSLSRVEMNELVPPEGAADIAGIAGDVMDSLAPVASARGVTVTLGGDADVRLTGEREELLQVVQNLVDNAVKYSKPGDTVAMTIGRAPGPAALAPTPMDAADPPRITLVAAPDNPGGFGWIRVQDHGPGIARQHLPRLGERFFRVEEGGVSAQAASGREGTGLGLAIVKRIVRRHSAALTVASVPGEGSTFTMTVPLAEDDQSRRRAVDAPDTTDEAQPTSP